MWQKVGPQSIIHLRTSCNMYPNNQLMDGKVLLMVWLYKVFHDKLSWKTHKRKQTKSQARRPCNRLGNLLTVQMIFIHVYVISTHRIGTGDPIQKWKDSVNSSSCNHLFKLASNIGLTHWKENDIMKHTNTIRVTYLTVPYPRLTIINNILDNDFLALDTSSATMYSGRVSTVAYRTHTYAQYIETFHLIRVHS